MSYQVTARKWRPMVFDDVIGQTHVSNTLRNALVSGRLAHAFIFSGTRGCGKTTTARILARAVNCLHPKNNDPCNECEICREIIDGRSMDVIEIDGASNRGVEEIRNLRESVRYAPSRGSKKVYIIDEVHMLTKEAFNALLKTLEEPPSHVLFIFATTEIHKVPATILSRCQRYDFRRISVDEIMGRLRYIAGQEGIAIDEDSLLLIAKKGDGSMRDAQSIFDQVVSFCGMTIAARQVAEALSIVDAELYFRVSEAVAAHDTKAGLALVDDVVQTGYDLKEFLAGLSEHLRNLLIVKTTGDAKMIEETDLSRARYLDTAAKFSVHDLLRLSRTVSELESEIRYSVQPRFKVEIAMVQMTKMEASVRIDALLAQIEDLKKKFPAAGSASGLTTPSQPSLSISAAAAGARETSSPQAKKPGASDSKPKFSVSISAPSSLGMAHPAAGAATVMESAAPSFSGSASSTASGASLSIERVKEEWASVVDEITRERINVGSMVSRCMPLEIAGGTLRIACPDAYHASTFLQYKDYLTPQINKFFSSRLLLEPVVDMREGAAVIPSSDAYPSLVSEGTAPGSPAPAGTARTQAEMEHPIVKILFRDFEADPL
ncbi:MAG: DNA polymerase III subunit gamma/tau [Acidobacteriota bacterium]